MTKSDAEKLAELEQQQKLGEEEEGLLNEKNRDLRGLIGSIVTIIAVAMSVFHLYTAMFGVFESIIQRGTHLGFALLLSFALYKPSKKIQQSRIPWYDIIAMILVVVSFSYYSFNGTEISSRFSYVMPLTTWELIVGVISLVLVLEATRRVVGNALVLIMIAFLLYGFYGHLLPGALSHREFNLMWIMDHLFYTTTGVFSTPLGVSATFIFLFILFGKFLEISGAGQFFINLSLAAMGKYRGGPAKTAIIGSSILGTISGSAVANTVTTGAFTIPLMKKTGYKKDFAGGVEAVSSTGGQIVPPIMGAAAFIIASYLGIPYVEIVYAAIIPALLYYICLYVQVDLRAKRNNLKGLKKEELPNLWAVLKMGFLFFVPLFVIIYMLVAGFSPMRAGLFAIVATIVIAMLKGATRFSFKQFIQALDLGARASLETAIACAAAGVIIGIIGLTGIGLKFSGIILDIAGGSLLVTLLLTMVVSIILGMGLPTVAAYIVQVPLTIPALIELGVEPIAAHLFIFYFAIISNITPPVALAAFAAAGIAGSEPMKTGLTAIRLGIAAFIVPYMFIYGPELLLIGGTVDIILAVITAVIGIMGIGAATEGWLLKKVTIFERVLLVAGSLCMVHPNFVTDLAGLVILASVYLIQKVTLAKNPELKNNLS
ncbi:TRAP transporter permease [Salinicoccus halitifaciens]|uniref:TRAP transporter 4TM/12TM fusion protein n=1 Tax=Salinicoccus halitifaciens TaxID=1073415 RepID=A0ABV2EAN6_9STAP|nr:TRAP transporter permease [Salinicoccus halitifaciens]MCD2138594.1 TRAP transporter permease [Salinicoccus halitifaciens]